MALIRRDFLKGLGGALVGGAVAERTALAGESGHGEQVDAHAQAVLVDLTMCIGCRLCEFACKKENDNNPCELKDYDDLSVFDTKRPLGVEDFTIVNAWQPPGVDEPIYAKRSCMHCQHPACVSACIVGALSKQQDGPVTYDAWKCIGCRYCMVACPFQVPTYTYDDPLTPKVRKCEMCRERTAAGELPACVEVCPRQTMIYGKRDELLEVAHQRIAESDDYVPHVYGEHEAGGTNVMYLSPVPFEKIGFAALDDSAPGALTETIQHSVFKYGLPPAILYGVLGLAMFFTRPGEDEAGGVATLSPPNDADPPSPRNDEEAIGVNVDRVFGEAATDEGAAIAESFGDEALSTVASDDATGQDRDHDLDRGHGQAAPARRKLLTPGVLLLAALSLTGLGAMAYRFIFGLAAATNLDQQYPWGLWIGIDVATGVALAAGGFTTAALIHVFHREHYHAVARPALLTAMLGYTFVVIGLQADLGRYYNVWHPLIMWQGNSVLFEVGMCVMCYLTVLYLEFAPIACEGLMARGDRFPRLAKLARWVHGKVNRIMFVLIIAGCVLSCLHQSSLGSLMVIAPTKLHALWWTPWLPLLFLMSAIMVGFPMVMWESLVASWSLKLKPEMHVLTPLARYVPVFMGLYLALRLGDVYHRGALPLVFEGSIQSWSWLAEVMLGVAVPMVMFTSGKVRRNRKLMLLAATLVVLGVLWNRVNVFIIGYMPPDALHPYVPSLLEVAVTVGLIATLMLVYRLVVTYLPVLHIPQPDATP